MTATATGHAAKRALNVVHALRYSTVPYSTAHVAAYADVDVDVAAQAVELATTNGWARPVPPAPGTAAGPTRLWVGTQRSEGR